ncbi:MAG: hypothetical protein U9Q03_06335 [Patescibacteria group bacterium]|nr:hypothetical protein [Patescibacteria group bacterium]
MGKISDKILNEIDKRGVQQTPAWRFTLSSVLMWFGLAFFLVFGSLSVSVMLTLLADNDWTGLEHFRGGPPGFIFSVVPYVWIVLATLLLAAAYFDFRKTKHGYRYRTPIIVGGAVLMSVMLGSALHAAGIGNRADMMLADRMPHYRQAVVRGSQLWNEPEDGRLMGRVESVVSESELEVNDMDGERWNVRVRGVRSRIQIEEGVRIRAIGEVTGEGEFSADRILPWQPKRLMQPRHMPYGINPASAAYNKQERSKRPMVHPAAGIRINNPEL